MKKIYFFIFLSALSTSINAQLSASFENLQLTENSFWNGADGSGEFTSGGITFNNSYNASWGSWSGFSYTNQTDVTTPGYANQYSAIAGAGHNSSNYATAYKFGTLKAELDSTSTVSGLYVTNSTYAYLSMLNGDEFGFSKKFGGDKGIDPDYFKLFIHGISEQGDTTGVVEFFLADFRFDNSLMDYIVDDWNWVDLSSLGKVKELHFALESTDNGAWGMNTPAYFCIDDVNGVAPIDPMAGKTIATIEDLALASESHYDGADLAGGFTSGGFHFKNNYNADWFSWSGFAASTSTDTETKGWANQFSAIAGSGAQSTNTYAVGYDFWDMDVTFDSQVVEGFYATNNAYTYWSIKEGDAYAKKFGGVDGTEPDWLKLTIEGFDTLQNSTGKVDFYLADFRFDDNSEDYILDAWKYVNLNSLGEVSSLHFSLSSSDNGTWGMNTPAYFCLDELNYKDQAPVVVNPIADIGHFDNPDRVFYIPIEDVFTDPDDDDSNITYFIESIDSPDLISASIVRRGNTMESLEKNIVINVTKELTGDAIITVGAESNGKTTLHSFKIVVNFPTDAELLKESVVSVYPNPFMAKITISLPGIDGRILLYDMNGRIIHDEFVDNQSSKEINGLNDLKPGMYVFQLSTSKQTIIKKIIKK